VFLSRLIRTFEIIFLGIITPKIKVKKFLYQFKDSRIKYFKSEKTYSLGEARNKAVSVCEGELVAFLDVDDWYLEEKLKLQVDVFKKNVNIGLVYTSYYYFDDLKKKKILFNYKIPQNNVPQKLLDDYNIGIVTVMIRKELFKKISFNQNLNFIEDFDLVVRLSLVTNFKNIETPTAYYRSHENNLSKKIADHVKELRLWKNSFEKYSEYKFNLKKLNSLINFLEIKNDIILGKKKIALKKIISNIFHGNKIKSLKYIFFLCLPNFIVKKNFENLLK